MKTRGNAASSAASGSASYILNKALNLSGYLGAIVFWVTLNILLAHGGEVAPNGIELCRSKKLAAHLPAPLAKLPEVVQSVRLPNVRLATCSVEPSTEITTKRSAFIAALFPQIEVVSNN